MCSQDAEIMGTLLHLPGAAGGGPMLLEPLQKAGTPWPGHTNGDPPTAVNQYGEERGDSSAMHALWLFDR
jgi:hypothetical protein